MNKLVLHLESDRIHVQPLKAMFFLWYIFEFWKQILVWLVYFFVSKFNFLLQNKKKYSEQQLKCKYRVRFVRLVQSSCFWIIRNVQLARVPSKGNESAILYLALEPWFHLILTKRTLTRDWINEIEGGRFREFVVVNSGERQMPNTYVIVNIKLWH